MVGGSHWRAREAAIRFVIFTAIAITLSLLAWGLPSEDLDSSYLFSAIPQTLGALFGLMFVALTFGSQSVSVTYGVSPADLLEDDAQFSTLTVAYLVTIGLSLVLVPLRAHPLFATPLDEFVVLGMVAWVLYETALLVGRVREALRGPGLLRHLISTLDVSDLQFDRPGRFDSVVQILDRVTKERLGESMACWEVLSRGSESILASGDIGQVRSAIVFLQVSIELVMPAPESRNAGWTYSRGVGVFVEGLRLAMRERRDPIGMRLVLDWTLRMSQEMSGRFGVKALETEPLRCGADLFSLEPNICMAVSRQHLEHLLKLFRSWPASSRSLSEEDRSEVESFRRAVESLGDATLPSG